MQNYSKVEFAVGGFVLLGAIALGFLAVSISGVDIFPRPWLRVQARFASVGDLKEGAKVKIAGVTVGEVEHIALEDYAAETALKIRKDIALSSDTMASIRTEGLLGESYVLIRPGGDEENLASGGRITETEPAIDLIDMVVKYALEKDDDAPADPLEEEL